MLNKILHSSHVKVFFIVALVFLSREVLELTIRLVSGFNILDLCKLDCGWYAHIAKNISYPPADPYLSLAFFPLHPFLVGVVHRLTGLDLTLSLIYVSKFFFFFGVIAFVYMATAFKKNLNVAVVASIILFHPYFMYGSYGYSEPMFFLLSSLIFLLLKQKRYVLAGIIAAPFTAVRFVAIFIGFSFLVSGIKDWNKFPRLRTNMLLGICLVPLGLALFMLYQYLITGDAIMFLHIQSLEANNGAWNNNIKPLSYFFSKSVIVTHLVSVLFAFFAVYYLIRNKLWHMAIFSFFATFIPLMTGWVSMSRYVWWQVPVILVLVSILTNRKAWIPFLIFEIGIFIYYSVGWLFNIGGLA